MDFANADMSLLLDPHLYISPCELIICLNVGITATVDDLDQDFSRSRLWDGNILDFDLWSFVNDGAFHVVRDKDDGS